MLLLVTLSTNGGGKELHVECKFLEVLGIFRGQLLYSILPVGTTKRLFKLSANAKSGTTQEFKEYENDEGTKITGIHLEEATDGGTFSEAAEFSEEEVETEKTTEIVN